MAESLIPDFSPEAYSSGQGSGYAQVFNLNAPNPFDVTGDTYKNLLAIEKDKLNASYENEKKRQEKLDEFLSSINDYDNAWATGQAQLTKKIDDYGNLIAGMRAKGTNLDLKSLNVSKKEIADLAKANQGNQKKYSEIAAMMADPLIYDDEERDLFQKEVKNAAAKDNGIMEVQSYLDKWKESLATPSLVADYIKIKPEAKSDKTGYIKATDPAEAKTVVVENVWAGYQPVQKKKLLQDLVERGLVSKDTVNAAKMEGVIDFENKNLKDEIGNALYTKIEPYLEKDVSPKPVYRSSTTTPGNNKYDKLGTSPTGNDPGELGEIALEKKGFDYFKTGMKGENDIYLDADLLKYDDEYVGSKGEKYPAGWYVYGTIQKEMNTKPLPASSASNADGAIALHSSQYNLDPNTISAQKEGDVWKFYKLERRRVPYNLNQARLETYGVDSIEAVAKSKGYKSVRGGSSSTNQQGNSKLSGGKPRK